jgi:hypothetical protein
MTTPLRQKPCDYCPAMISWIETPAGRRVPVEAEPVMRHGSDPLPKGKYFDAAGNCYSEHDAPCKWELYRSHWADCPGRDRARAAAAARRKA